jgi:hypothetical protein
MSSGHLFSALVIVTEEHKSMLFAWIRMDSEAEQNQKGTMGRKISSSSDRRLEDDKSNGVREYYLLLLSL